MYWDGRAWHRNAPPQATPPPVVVVKKRSGCMTVTLVGITLLAGSCIVAIAGIGSDSESDKKTISSSSSASSSFAAPSTVDETTTAENRPPPTDAEVVQAFQAYIKERADAGVMMAQAVTSVTASGGVVTITLDAPPALLELSPFDNEAEWLGTPAAFNNNEGIWLRKKVQRVDVVNADGTSLGSMTAAELNKGATG